MPQSPIIMERVLKHLDGDPDPESLYEMIEITRADNRELLATCMMSDEMSIETIADRLSAMRLSDEANRLRKLVSRR